MITLTVRADGSGEITLPSSGTQHITAASIDDARDQLLDLVIAEAADTGAILRVAAHDPDAIYHLVVHPDGAVEPDQPQAGTVTAPTAAPAAAGTSTRKQPRIIAGVLVASVAVGGLGAVAIALSRPAPAPTAAPQRAAAAVQQPSSAPSAAVTPVTTVELDPTNADWPVPRDPTAGPRTWTPTRASGFSRDARGAAWAAATITARLDPYMGPAVFTPALAQTTGQSAAVAPLLNGAYLDGAAKAGSDTSSGGPVVDENMKMLAFAGWATTGDCRQRCAVALAVDDDGARWVQTAPMVWSHGDWKLYLAKPDRILDPRIPADPDQTFRPFTVTKD